MVSESRPEKQVLKGRKLKIKDLREQLHVYNKQLEHWCPTRSLWNGKHTMVAAATNVTFLLDISPWITSWDWEDL